MCTYEIYTHVSVVGEMVLAVWEGRRLILVRVQGTV